MINVTFKKHPHPTGLSSVGANTRIDLKIKKKVFGYISSPHWNSKERQWWISIAVKSNEGGGFTWRKLVQRGDNEDEMRKIAKAVLPKIIAKGEFELHFFED